MKFDPSQPKSLFKQVAPIAIVLVIGVAFGAYILNKEASTAADEHGSEAQQKLAITPTRNTTTTPKRVQRAPVRATPTTRNTPTMSTMQPKASRRRKGHTVADSSPQATTGWS